MVILIGMLMVSSDQKHTMIGVSIMIAGTVVLLERFGLLSGRLGNLIIILIVILIGVMILNPAVGQGPQDSQE